MGLRHQVRASERFRPVPGTAELAEPDQHYLSDVERIAHTLVKQAGAPAEAWPFFVEPAEALIRFSMKWSEPS